MDEGEEKKDEPLSPDSTKPNEDSTKPNEDSPATSANDPLQSEKAVTPPLFVISDKKASRPFDCFGFGVHLLLFFLALACAASFCLSEIHKNYFVPVVERARRTDDDLMDEYTYYDRQCSLQDVTATPEQAREQLWIKENQPTSSKEVDGVEQMMTHGAVMIPELLSPQSVEELRAFVVQKNRAVKGTPAEFPVSQGFARISYGIEATEDPSVIRALKEIHGSEPLGKLLEGLVGKNPALTEITAITSGYGAPHQVWHSDVKSDGNGIKFGRTYSHSYSLFLALQNTTGAMGATDLCPGTHYCTNRISSVCESRKIGLHQLRPENIWRAGDAALLSQQVWHRGTKHTDPNAQERIIFIVSFIGRPADPRQLARGTYFHMKWNMW